MRLPAFLLNLLILLCLISVFNPAYAHLIMFGDSLSDAGSHTPLEDIGNNEWAKAPGKTGAPIVNPDVSTGLHPLWVNWLVASLYGEKIYPWRVLQANHLNPEKYSVNFAFASAETGDHWLNDLSTEAFPPYIDDLCKTPQKINEKKACVPGVLKQIGFYLQAVPKPSPDTIFIIWAGGNDMLNNIHKLFQWKKIFSLPISNPIKNILAAKDRLIAAGVKPEQIYILNLPDLSKTPAGIRIAAHQPSILYAMGFLTRVFNKGLLLTLSHDYFNDNNLPASHIFSIYKLFNKIIRHPENYNITEVQNSCMNEQAMPACKGYVFFNDKHPTMETGKIIAYWAQKAIQRPPQFLHHPAENHPPAYSKAQ